MAGQQAWVAGENGGAVQEAGQLRTSRTGEIYRSKGSLRSCQLVRHWCRGLKDINVTVVLQCNPRYVGLARRLGGQGA